MLKDQRITVRLCDNCERLIDDKEKTLTLKIAGKKEENTNIEFSYKNNKTQALKFYQDLHFCCFECFSCYFSVIIDEMEERL